MKYLLLFTMCRFSVAVENDGGDDGKIVGGYDAADGEFPYQISLRYNGRHICGGSIIDHHWILTAAHCVDGQKPDNFTIVTGTNLLSIGGDVYPVHKIIQHKKYNSNSIRNDIALIRTNEEIKYNEKVRNIQLPTEDTGYDHELTLSGWGRTKYPGDIPDKLQTIKLMSISNIRCTLQHPVLGLLMGRVASTNICTYTKDGEGACHGDSGGPLVEDNYQVGVVSWGIPCAKGRPDVFTRVFSYLDWLHENMKEEEPVEKSTN